MSDYRSIEEAQGNWPDADSIERKRRQRELESLHDQLTAAQSRVEELERENQKYERVNKGIDELTADNQQLRELLRECLPIVRHSVDGRFNVELPTYQNRLQLRDRIKAAIGE